MITALDTSVLIDIFGADPGFGVQSSRAVRSSAQQGRLIACGVVWAEVCVAFPSSDAAVAAMTALEVEFSAIDEAAALVAGRSFAAYRAHGGTRDRVIPDFLIAAHSLVHADRLLTRDQGFFRTNFSQLAVVDPTAAE